MIYTITSTTDDAYTHQRSVRTWGFYLDESDAKLAILHNSGDLRESFYDFVVMEKYAPGVLTLCLEEIWFKWNNDKWIECDKPTQFKGVTNWAMG